jgi:hypothetical protein
MKDYGINSNKAFTDDCQDGKLHAWVFKRRIGRCYTEFVCKTCGALCRIDSGD